MKLEPKQVPVETLSRQLEAWLKADRRSDPGSGPGSEAAGHEHGDAEHATADRRLLLHDRRNVVLDRRVNRRLGYLTSIDGGQIAVLLLDPSLKQAEIWQSEIINNSYTSLTLALPQVHWWERLMWNLFGIVPQKHPRLKPVAIHDDYQSDFYPLRKISLSESDERQVHDPMHFLEVAGEGVWELPVGPIHAGIIEPGHFRFSCLGETIVNLELRLGYVHRGVEKRMTEVPWQKARFVAEAAASDSACANALAHAIAIESILDLEVSPRANFLRTIALETERVAMHIADVGGMMTDIGMVGLAATMSRLRGIALNLAQTLSGSRFLRAYIRPGGVTAAPSPADLAVIREMAADLAKKLKPVLSMFQENQAAIARMDAIGKIKRSLASEFGFVGVAARACGLNYDTRKYYSQGLFPDLPLDIALENGGDIWSRTNVRIKEIWTSLALIEKLVADATLYGDSPCLIAVPEKLPANRTSIGIVEAFRGELIHMCVTSEDGSIRRYAIKDPSANNWTMISIIVRENLIADFPLCNKSLSLSYSGNDL